MTDHIQRAPALGALPVPPAPLVGIVCGLSAAFIWGTWPVVTSIGVNADALTPFQLVLLRFAVAGPLLLPFAFRGNPGLKEWGQALVMMLGAGFPYSLVVSSAFEHAPAGHGGVIIPGTMLVTSLVLAHIWFGEKITRTRALGAAAIITGLVCLAGGGMVPSLKGDLLFMAGGLMWAGYTFFVRQWPTNGLVIAARVSVLSLLLVAIGSVFGLADGITGVARETILTQGLWQGVVSAILALVLFNKAVGYLGTSRAATLNALIPVVAVVLSFLVLGEVPSPVELLGLVAIIGGIGVAMGVRLRRIRKP
ncbi:MULTISPECIES: DMT family transporter [Kordiimonas]|jgi:drug/metabolite transporter (DMT)-like permease|uniref:EamA domain-containing membrane protein RarD n=1 Tax=Kordiimonas lacus TaxID=637679 RepID=A0A1G7E6L0_9PROT|nr:MULTISPECIES: DMT family transporter [Kordiimonas]SDE59331.1 EamA domain-containing membrane protein RarD [Kordiimonas lacus]